MTYICAECKKEYSTTWTDEEARLEYKEHFDEPPGEDAKIVCDDCYRKIMERNEGPDWAKK